MDKNFIASVSFTKNASGKSGKTTGVAKGPANATDSESVLFFYP